MKEQFREFIQFKIKKQYGVRFSSSDYILLWEMKMLMVIMVGHQEFINENHANMTILQY